MPDAAPAAAPGNSRISCAPTGASSTPRGAGIPPATYHMVLGKWRSRARAGAVFVTSPRVLGNTFYVAATMTGVLLLGCQD